jgi:uncharacterized protein (DUF3084 family)
MADGKLYWINQKGTFGAGPDALRYGDPVDPKKIGEGRLKKLKAEGKIGELVVPVDNSGNRKVDGLKKTIEQLKKDNARLVKEHKEAIEQNTKAGNEKLTKVKGDLESENKNLKAKIEAAASNTDCDDCKKIDDTVTSLNEKIAELETSLTEKDEKIAELETSLTEKDEKIAELETLINDEGEKK